MGIFEKVDYDDIKEVRDNYIKDVEKKWGKENMSGTAEKSLSGEIGKQEKGIIRGTFDGMLDVAEKTPGIGGAAHTIKSIEKHFDIKAARKEVLGDEKTMTSGASDKIEKAFSEGLQIGKADNPNSANMKLKEAFKGDKTDSITIESPSLDKIIDERSR